MNIIGTLFHIKGFIILAITAISSLSLLNNEFVAKDLLYFIGLGLYGFAMLKLGKYLMKG